MITPYTLPGFMELMPVDQVKFDYLKNTIEKTYLKYGFLPLDTPVIEGADILLAKAGGETEKQIYRFNKGDSDLCLRFDLTVPLAKFIAMNQGQLSFPFRRYQIGKVYRGERAQKGRYREFYQCDIDVIGDEDLPIIYDVEMPCIIKDIFDTLGLDFEIRINNRKVLNGLFTSLGVKNTQDVMRIIDKYDKIGKDAVADELVKLGLQGSDVVKLMEFVAIEGSSQDKIDKARAFDIQNEEYLKGLDELEQVIQHVKTLGAEDTIVIDFKIARGLDYYTGTVYETFIKGHENVGSVCSGGRYDNLASHYTNKKFPGVGISIGLTRLYYVLNELDLMKQVPNPIKVLVLPMDNAQIGYALKVAKAVRDLGVNCDTYFADKKFKNKLNYANKQGVPFVAIVGENEEKDNAVTIKNMFEHTQGTVKLDSLKNILG